MAKDPEPEPQEIVIGDKVAEAVYERFVTKIWENHETILQMELKDREKKEDRLYKAVELAMQNMKESNERIAVAQEQQAESLKEIHLGIQQILQALHAPTPAKN